MDVTEILIIIVLQKGKILQEIPHFGTLQCGFESQLYFNACIKRIFGFSLRLLRNLCFDVA